ncbi:MAG: histidine kinase [Cyclobacteriaceae bacterium]|nr:histidine kinase [Cyclobacteriaceae bacterium]UYN88444.1 MAG: histidine kinase [Cyclobacteriaceae bacterium]
MFFIAEASLFLCITHFFRLYLNRRQWIRLKIPRLIPRVLLASGALAIVAYFFRIPLGFITGRTNVLDTAFNPDQVLGLSIVYMVFFFLWSVFYFTYHFIEQYNKSLKYEASMVEIELNNLKSQLNPHFIFNALNSIRALVDENPKKSKQAINQLSNILRNSLAYEKKGLTRFEDELKMVKDYLSLESVRFEERLKTDFSIDPQSAGFRVPPLMVQTLVENGVKHGISKLTEGGVIQLRTIVENNRLKIQIRNSGQILNGARRGRGGLGITNTIQRLKLLYGDEATFRMVNENDSFVLTEITIPQNPHTA